MSVHPGGKTAMRPFSKNEKVGLAAIFLVLIFISVPNFVASIKRARDQIRRDDMGTIEKALSAYQQDFGSLPGSSPDGKIIACKDPEGSVTVDARGRYLIDLVPCEWGKDSIIDLTPGGTKVYLDRIPGDPDAAKGVNYVYFSDGRRYQIFSAFEVEDQAEISQEVVARAIACGSRTCNVGRSYNCPIGKSIEQYDKEINQ